jgi:hypothetical protein
LESVVTKVFISVGRAATERQKEFVRSTEQLLLQRSMQPCRAQFSSVQPLKKIEEVMRQCAGTVIIAFERVFVERGSELRSGEDEKALESERLPSVWNQIEAAMAYGMGHPLLVLCETGLRIEGLLDDRYDWYVQRIALDKKLLLSEEFQGVFADWEERVRRRADEVSPAPQGSGPVDAQSLTLGQIISSMTPSQIWGVGAAVVPALAGLVYLAFWLGQNAPGAPN